MRLPAGRATTSTAQADRPGDPSDNRPGVRVDVTPDDPLVVAEAVVTMKSAARYFDLDRVPWAGPPFDGDSDKWGDEQDRSEYFEDAAYYWSGRAWRAERRAKRTAAAVARCDQYIKAGVDVSNIARDIRRILNRRGKP